MRYRLQTQGIIEMTRNELHAAKTLAVGRLVKMLSRPFEDGDIEAFYKCKDVLMTSENDMPILHHQTNAVGIENIGMRGRFSAAWD